MLSLVRRPFEEAWYMYILTAHALLITQNLGDHILRTNGCQDFALVSKCELSHGMLCLVLG